MKHIYLSLFLVLSASFVSAQIDTVQIDTVQWKSQADLGNCDDMSAYDGDTVTVKGVVIMDGAAYGSSSHNVFIQGPNGGPWNAIHLRDGDGQGYTEEIPNLFAGWEVFVTGRLSQYQGETQLEPSDGPSIKLVSTSNPIFQDTITAADLNDDQRNNILPSGEQWEGQFVRMENLEVQTVDFFSGGSRVSFVVKDANNNLVNVSDYFFVQKLPVYTHPTTNLNGSFSPPSVGDQFKALNGVVIHSKNDCPGESGRGYELHPFAASHYEYGPSAPRVSDVSRNPQVPASSDSVVVTANIVDLDGAVTGAVLKYRIGTDPSNTSFNSVTMTAGTGDSYSATIPAQGDGSFVRYFIEATDDSTNTTSVPSSDPTSSTYAYRVRDNGLTIFDLQYTPYSNGESIFRDAEVTVTGIVTASAAADDLGYVYIQDENQIGGWSGIMATQNPSLATLTRGDKVTITGTVNENSSRFTVLENVTNILSAGTGSITPTYFQPDSFTTYQFPETEMFEGVLMGLVNPTATGNGKVHIVDVNADAPSNFGEYRVGRDPFDPSNGTRVLAGRKSSTAFSSYNVSYVVDSSYFSSLLVPGVAISDTMNMDTLMGIMHYSFGSMKLLPRNNDDFMGINIFTADTTDTTDTNTTVFDYFFESPKFMEVFPNPAQDELYIQTQFNDEVHSIEFIDVQGREVFKRITNETNSTIYLNSFDPGIYTVRLIDSEGRRLQHEKIVIQK